MIGRHDSDRRSSVAASAMAVALLAGCVLAASPAEAAKATKPSNQALIRDALSAAPPTIARTATVMGWDGTILRKGTGAYHCMPTQPDKRARGEREPMCLDKVWMEWGDAWVNKKPFKASATGIAYMLAGDTGSSNTDPYGMKPTRDNQWIVEGAHIMVLLPDAAQLEGLPTDPKAGGPYVMWKGTPYAHIMIPVGKRPAAKTP